MSTPLYIVTGASRGLGHALVGQLLQPGARVLAMARHTADDLDTLARERGAGLTQWAIDLTDPGPAAERMTEWLTRQRPADDPACEGPPSAATLINNAGLLGRPESLSGQRAADLSPVIRVGLEAALVLTAAFLRATAEWAGPRRVLNVSSGLGRRAMAGGAAYCAAKAGMDHFSRCVALEEATRPNGARVASVAPGVIDTDMQAELRAADTHALPERDRYVQLQAQGQLVSANETARRMLQHLHSAAFGEDVVADIRAL